MSGEQELDRNEDATPYRLSEARKKGQVAKSAELASAIVLAVAAIVLYAKGWDALVDQFKLGQRLFGLTGSAAANLGAPWWLWDLTTHVLTAALVLLLPIWAVLMIAAVLAHLGQTGFVWSWHPVKPDWKRLHPMNGVKRLFSVRTLFDGGKAVIKLLLFALLIGWALADLVPRFSHVAGLTAAAYAHEAVAAVADVALKVAVALCLIALVDAVFSHREFAKRMRMSRREVRDEVKHREGDPRIRARLRALRREMLKRSASLRRTATADLVITNPTHIAVALRYKHGQMDAPVLVSKGAGGMAAAIRLIAARHRIPVVCSPTLARALNRQAEIDGRIPLHLYGEVARLMVWLLASRRVTPASAGVAA